MLDELMDQIKRAVDRGEPMRIVGGDSKHFLGNDLSSLPSLSTSGLSKLISYEPSELVVQVEAGYPIKDLVELLDGENQMLGFDPADLGASTIGGTVATGLSGSRRPFIGACRDFLLGASLLDGMGNHLEFGGQVMKNVAGYDVSRLLAGSYGCLGLITEVSFKVLPKPECEMTVRGPVDRERLLPLMAKLGLKTETSGLAYWQGDLYVRFTGSESSVKACSDEHDGELVSNDIWRQIDTLELFDQDENLWRVSTEPSQSGDGFAEADLIDWAGGQRWVTNQKPEITVGHLTCVKHTGGESEVFSPLDDYVMAIHKKLKTSFDPNKILNPGKMYRQL